MEHLDTFGAQICVIVKGNLIMLKYDLNLKWFWIRFSGLTFNNKMYFPDLSLILSRRLINMSQYTDYLFNIWLDSVSLFLDV